MYIYIYICILYINLVPWEYFRCFSFSIFTVMDWMAPSAPGTACLPLLLFLAPACNAALKGILRKKQGAGWRFTR